MDKSYSILLPKLYERVFLKDLAKVNKTLAKYNSHVDIINTEQTFLFVNEQEGGLRWEHRIPQDPKFVMESDGKQGSVDGYKVPAVAYELALPQVRGKEGVTFIGFVEYKLDIPTIYAVSEEYHLRNYLEEKAGSCDHCHSKRHRTKYFYFLENNEVKAIGSSCVKEWYGLNLELIFGKFFDLFYDYSLNLHQPSEEETFRIRQSAYFKASSVIAALGVVTKNFRDPWNSVKDSNELFPATKNATLGFLVARPEELKQEAKDLYEEYLEDDKMGAMKDTVSKYWDKPVASDFEFNIQTNLFDDQGLREDFLGANLGVICYGIWKAFNDIHQREIDEANRVHKNQFLGEVGSRITLKGILKRVHSFQSYTYSFAGSPETLAILILETKEGVAKWVTSTNLVSQFYQELHGDKGYPSKEYYELVEKFNRDGFEVSLTGTVKKYEEYKGENQTVLSRCKVNLV